MYDLGSGLGYRRIVNKALSFSANAMQRYNVHIQKEDEVSHGMVQQQWYLRNYWQAVYTVKNKGFILFDTLTYDDAHLPHLSEIEGFEFLKQKKYAKNDFSCFRQSDFPAFINRMRSALDYAGWQKDGNLSYFFTSEYGHNDIYEDSRGHMRQGTKRPHYHVLFYCTIPGMTPDVLSHFIHDEWQNGRTDGIDDGGMDRVRRNSIGDGCSRLSDVDIRKLVCYVSKYITKDLEIHDELRQRIYKAIMCKVADNGERIDNSHFSELWKSVSRRVLQYHRQSQHFGEYALAKENFGDKELDSVIDGGFMVLPDFEHGVRKIPVPVYYTRKLFSKQVKKSEWQRDENGDFHKVTRRFWVPSKLGRKTFRRRTESQLQRYEQRLRNVYLNGEFVNPDNGVVFTQSDIDRMLNGRGYRELAEYACLYKDRLCPSWFRYSLPPDVDTVCSMQLSYNPLRRNKYRRYGECLFEGNREVPAHEFQEMVINDSFFAGQPFRGFDALLYLFDFAHSEKRRKDNETAKFRREQKKKFKNKKQKS